MKILIYADNGRGVGLGHLTRCISLAHKFTELFYNTLLIVNEDRSYKLDKKFSKLKIKQLRFSKKKILNLKKEFKPDFFVVDSYNFKNDFLLQLKKDTLTVGFDDFSKYDLPFDIIINSNPYANEKNYDKLKFLLLGEKYQIIKSDILKTNHIKLKKEIKNIIILTGGDDFNKVTNRICDYLNYSPILSQNNIICNFIVGPYNKISSNLSDYKNINFHFNPKNLSDLMSKSDLAITASGQTLYELCYLGVPSIAFLTGKDQKSNMDSLSKKGVIFQIGNSSSNEFISKLNLAIIKMINDFEMRKNFYNKSKNLIDGLGALRISNALKRYIKNKN